MKHLLNGGIKSFPFHHSAALFEIGENEARRKAIEWIQATRVIAKTRSRQLLLASGRPWSNIPNINNGDWRGSSKSFYDRASSCCNTTVDELLCINFAKSFSTYVVNDSISTDVRLPPRNREVIVRYSGRESQQRDEIDRLSITPSKLISWWRWPAT